MMNKSFTKNNVFIYLLFITLIILLLEQDRIKVRAESNVWDGSISSNFEGGIGTEEDPYQIANGSQLALLAKYVNDNVGDYTNSYYILTDNIILNETSNFTNWYKQAPVNIWTSIGNTTFHPFKGVFDGNNHKIFGMYGNGLFFDTSGTVIKNVSIQKSYLPNGGAGIVYYLNGILDNGNFSGIIIIKDKDHVAGIVGFNEMGSSITNSYNYASITDLKQAYNLTDVGGIVGENRGTINNCYNKGDISLLNENQESQDNNHGGIAGFNWGIINKCYNQGNIICGSSGDYVGGITGFNYDTITQSNNEGKITTGKNNTYIGGIAGGMSNGTKEPLCYIDECDNKGSIICDSSNKYIGGIVGRMFEGNIKECNNKNNIIIGNDSMYIGGIIGQMDEGKIINCSNKNSIEIEKNSYNIGGIVGYEYYKKGNEINSCYNIGSIKCKNYCSSVGGIAGCFNTLINNSFNKGTITLDKKCSSIGGIIGYTTKGNIQNCYNIGNILDKTYSSSSLGGIVGDLGCMIINYNPKITNCYNQGNVSGDFYVGGIAGACYKNIYNSYNVGLVLGNSDVGGILGRDMGGKASNCYFMKGTAKLFHKNTLDTLTKGGIELAKKQMLTSFLTSKLNNWVKAKNSSVYSYWCSGSSKKNNGYPYLKDISY